jgi:hypothetical protein
MHHKATGAHNYIRRLQLKFSSSTNTVLLVHSFAPLINLNREIKSPALQESLETSRWGYGVKLCKQVLWAHLHLIRQFYRTSSGATIAQLYVQAQAPHSANGKSLTSFDNQYSPADDNDHREAVLGAEDEIGEAETKQVRGCVSGGIGASGPNMLA